MGSVLRGSHGSEGRDMKAEPRVSIVLPTLNGMETLPEVFDALDQQRTAFAFEKVAVDSGSTDGTREFLSHRADRLIEISPAEFDHGATRNLGIEAAGGDLVVLLVQDAVPASSDWLDALTAPFAEDDSLAGTFARQLPRPDASRVTRYALGRWVAAWETPYTSAVESPEAFGRLSPEQRFRRSAFDNVCSCLRRSVWQRTPFRPIPIAEDLAWAREVLLIGHKLAYVPGAAVEHSHERSALYEFRRTQLVHRLLYELFGMRTIPTRTALCRSWSVTLVEHLRVLRRGEGPTPGPAEVLRTLSLALVWPLGQYLGGRADVRSKQLGEG